MRLWSIHPKYLDTQGLLALWREGLLAQKVLQGKTKGYRNHPQLERFKKQKDPAGAVSAYLLEVWKEADRRGYAFNAEKIASHKILAKIPVTQGQLVYEFEWLCGKLKKRDPARHKMVAGLKKIDVHPRFKAVAGPVEKWERV